MSKNEVTENKVSATTKKALFDNLNGRSTLMNVKVAKVTKSKGSDILAIEREINATNLAMVLAKLHTYFKDIVDSKGWNNKFSHGSVNMLFLKDEEGANIYPADGGNALFNEIIDGSMYIKGMTKVSGSFIIKSITENKISLALKLFIIGMFPNVQIVETDESGAMIDYTNKNSVPFNLILVNVIYLCMFGREKLNSHADTGHFLPEMYDSTVMNEFMTATGLHRA